jgi:hypothetical protein
MADRAPDERRTEVRKQKNLFCQIECGGKCYTAVILDISPSGMFVRTAAAAPPGSDVEITIRVAGGQVWQVRAVIAREPQPASGRKAIPDRGLGLRITHAPDGYAEFVASL